MDAVGILEVFGLTAAFVAADAGCKAGNVTIGAMDPRTNRPMRINFRYRYWYPSSSRGSVEDVKAAMESRGSGAAKTVSGVYSKYIIARPDEETEKMLDISCLGKYRPMET